MRRPRELPGDEGPTTNLGGLYLNLFLVVFISVGSDCGPSYKDVVPLALGIRKPLSFSIKLVEAMSIKNGEGR